MSASSAGGCRCYPWTLTLSSELFLLSFTVAVAYYNNPQGRLLVIFFSNNGSLIRFLLGPSSVLKYVNESGTIHNFLLLRQI